MREKSITRKALDLIPKDSAGPIPKLFVNNKYGNVKTTVDGIKFDSKKNVSKNWTSVSDKMPERSEAGKDFYCVHKSCMGRWVEKSVLCDPLESEYEPKTDDEKLYFASSYQLRGPIVQTKTIITHWTPDFELPEVTQRSSLFDLGTALNPITLKDGE